jgi:protein-tyrosine phosphatase
MSDDPHLDWDGCCNVRDLGGLRSADGRTTRRGAVVRADALDRLTAAGWSALHEYGIGTVIDLRNDDERAPDVAPRPAGIETVHAPLDGIEDTDFWDHWAGGPQLGTPLYYGPFLERFPQRTTGVIAVVARARPGGVVVHCGVGRDRTGLIAMLLLALVGVAPADVAADYELSSDRVRTLLHRLGQEDHVGEIEEFLRREGTSAREAVISTLTALDVEAHLRGGGLGDGDLAAVRARLLEPPKRSDPQRGSREADALA